MTWPPGMATTISALENDPAVPDDAPQADAGGPYVGTEGVAISFDASASSSPTPITLYEWDFDGEGDFDDATGVTPVYTFNAAGHRLVGVRASNQAGYANIAYAPVRTGAVNEHPEVTAFSPLTTSLEIAVGITQTFTVTVSDPDGDGVSVKWYVDNVVITDGLSLTYSPQSSDAGSHLIGALATDDHPAGGAVQQIWSVHVLDVDADGDGWRANADCDDTDPNVNPAMVEIPDNGLDDDCDPATTDIGTDLTVVAVDISGIDTNPHTLVTIGQAQIGIHNAGSGTFSGTYETLLFDDANGDARFDRGVDMLLGRETFSGTLTSGTTTTLDIPLSGIVSFRDNLVYAWLDSAQQVIEADETNNVGHGGQSSLYQPPVGEFQPIVEWQWDDPNGNLGVSMAPVVAPITDTNGDGLISERDVPAVIVSTDSELVALRGDTGQKILGIPIGFGLNRQAAVGDINDDGNPELMVREYFSGDVNVFDNSGAHLWTGTEPNWNGTTTALADLDADGLSEVLHGKTVFNDDGSVEWDGNPLYIGGNPGGAAVQAADLNRDGAPEVVIGPSAYDRDKNLLWRWSSYVSCGGGCYQIKGELDGGATTELFTSTMAIADGWSVVVNLDDEPYPEVVVVTSQAGQAGAGPLINDVLWIFEHDGRIHAGPFAVTQDVSSETEYRLGAPAVADFNGDGELEIAIAARKYRAVGVATPEDPTRIILRLFRFDGSLIWQKDLIAAIPVNGAPPVAAFDFDGDGASELVYLDVQKLYILDGSDGETLFELAVDRMNDGNPIRYPTIADVDNDGNAEIVVPTYQFYQAGAPPRYGVLVLGDSLDNWGHARRVWNQWLYHVTHVEEDGSIPPVARNNWEVHNNHRTQVPIEGLHRFAVPDMTLSRVIFNQDLCPAGAGITARVGNGGGLHVPAGLPVNFYLGDPEAGGTLLGVVNTTQPLYPGEFEDVTYDWNGPAAGQVFVAINETVTNPLTTTANLAQLPHTWAQGSGLSSVGSAIPVNNGAFRGIDGNAGTGWYDDVINNIDPTHYYEVHFLFPVNASEVTIDNSFVNTAFLSGTLSFSNGYTTTFSLDAYGEGTISFSEQVDITWLRLEATSTKSNGVSLNEIVIAGSYREPVVMLNEGNGRLANNKAASSSLVSPCDTVTNQPPQIVSSPVVTALIDAPYTYTVQAIDPNNDIMAYRLTNAPVGASIDPAAGTITWSPTITDLGSHNMAVQVEDSGALTVTQRFTVTVACHAYSVATALTTAETLDANIIFVSLMVTNTGGLVIPRGLPIALYDGDPDVGGSFIGAGQTDRTLAPGEGQSFRLDWTGASAGQHSLYVMPNDDGQDGNPLQLCASAPSAQQTLEILDLPLAADWNLVGSYVNPLITAVDVVQRPISGSYQLIHSYDIGDRYYYPNLPSFASSLTDVDAAHGYGVKADSGANSWRIVGQIWQEDTPLPLDAGWNLVSYLPRNSQPITQALQSIAGQYTAVLGFAAGAQSYYADTDPIFNTLDTMTPLSGYWIKMTVTGTLQYSLPPTGHLDKQPYTPSAANSSSAQPTNTWMNFYGTARLVNKDSYPPGTVVQAIDPDDVICGEVTTWVAERYGFLPCYGDDLTTTADEGALPGDTIRLLIGGEVLGSGVWIAHGERQWVALGPAVPHIETKIYLPLVLADAASQSAALPSESTLLSWIALPMLLLGFLVVRTYQRFL